MRRTRSNGPIPKGEGIIGGWMSYQRMRNRNNLMYRKPDDDRDPYWRIGNVPPWEGEVVGIDRLPEGKRPSLHAVENHGLLIGDLNRMERDYLGGPNAGAGIGSRDVNATGESLSHEVAAATGVDIETVKRVLRYVFLEQP